MATTLYYAVANQSDWDALGAGQSKYTARYPDYSFAQSALAAIDFVALDIAPVVEHFGNHIGSFNPSVFSLDVDRFLSWMPAPGHEYDHATGIGGTIDSLDVVTHTFTIGSNLRVGRIGVIKTTTLASQSPSALPGGFASSASNVILGCAFVHNPTTPVNDNFAVLVPPGSTIGIVFESSVIIGTLAIFGLQVGDISILGCIIDTRKFFSWPIFDITGSISGSATAHGSIMLCHSESLAWGSGAIGFTGNSNSSSDGTAPGLNPAYNIVPADFIDADGGNFNVAPGSVLIGTGYQWAADSIDAAGNQRVAPWDRGPYDSDGVPSGGGGEQPGNVFIKPSPRQVISLSPSQAGVITVSEL